MICNQTESGWEIIFQRAHALLAAKLVAPWRPEQRPVRWVETLNAIAQHDNGWQEWERGDRVTEAGAPRDFTQMPLEQIVLQAERVVTRAWHQSLWSGLLVSRHISHLYESRRSESASMAELLDAQQVWRQKWRRCLGVSRQEVDAGYALLLWGDSLSLILCRRALPDGESTAVIGRGPGGKEYTWRQRGDGSLSVSPWPFALQRFCVDVDVHRLQQTTFASDNALASALQEANIVQQRWEFWTE